MSSPLLAQAAPPRLLAQAEDPEVVRETVDAVLSQADYALTGGPSLIDRAVGAFLEQLGRLLLRFDSDGGAGSILAALALIGLVVALVVALGIFLRRLRRSAPVQTVVEGPVGRPAVQWAEEAERHERAGELRQALRCRYRETVAHLAAASLIEEIPGRTTGEYSRDVAAAVPTAAVPFEALTRRFEDAWYGGRPVDADTMASVRDDQALLMRAAGLGRRLATRPAGPQPVGAGTPRSEGDGP